MIYEGRKGVPEEPIDLTPLERIQGNTEGRAGSENRARRTRAKTRREDERQDEGKSNEGREVYIPMREQGRY